MKAIFEKITIEDTDSIRVYDFENTHFDAPWHFHPEFELTLILKSTGKRYVGSNIEDFVPGDLVLIGPNLPHIWKNNYSSREKGQKSKAIVIHFTETFVNSSFFRYKGMKQIKALLETSKFGLKFDRSTSAKTNSLIKKLPSQEGFEKVLTFLTIIHYLSEHPHSQRLNGNDFLPNLDINSSKRINEVCKFIYANFHQSITLKQLANIADMSENAFSRYFKNIVGTAVSKFIIQVRVNHACYLLIETDLTVSEICYSCGFNSISNFNKRFKNVKGTSPMLFRTDHEKRL